MNSREQFILNLTFDKKVSNDEINEISQKIINLISKESKTINDSIKIIELGSMETEKNYLNKL